MWMECPSDLQTVSRFFFSLCWLKNDKLGANEGHFDNKNNDALIQSCISSFNLWVCHQEHFLSMHILSRLASLTPLVLKTFMLLNSFTVLHLRIKGILDSFRNIIQGQIPIYLHLVFCSNVSCLAHLPVHMDLEKVKRMISMQCLAQALSLTIILPPVGQFKHNSNR